jgi:Ca2+/Na+ antiporter
MSNVESVILTKQGIFESINRTTFTITGIVIALLASTQTQIYNTNNFKFIIRIIALAILLINILYTYNNIRDFNNYILKHKNIYDITNLSLKVTYMYMLLSLLIMILFINIYLIITL